MKWRSLNLDFLGLLLILVLLTGLFGLYCDHFLTARTFTTILNQIPDLAVIAVGMTLVLVIGGIDLSVGSVMALSAVLLGVALVDWGWPLWLAAALAVASGGVCGVVNGLVSVHWRIPSFIVSLGMLEIARGAAYLVTHSETKYIGAVVESIGAPLPNVGFSPAVVVALVVVALGQLMLTRSVFGRYILGIGANETAMCYSGIDPRPLKVTVFAICGLLTGLAGIFQASRLATADPNAGMGLELSAIAAVVIGGTRLTGGKGSVLNTLCGVLIIAVLQTGLAQLGASEPSKRVITGVVIVVAVIADVYRGRLSVNWRRLQESGRRRIAVSHKREL